MQIYVLYLHNIFTTNGAKWKNKIPANFFHNNLFQTQRIQLSKFNNAPSLKLLVNADGLVMCVIQYQFGRNSVHSKLHISKSHFRLSAFYYSHIYDSPRSMNITKVSFILLLILYCRYHS